MEKDLLDQGDRALQHHPCPFETPLLSGRWGCALAERYLIALREGINCTDHQAHGDCQTLLAMVQTGSRFALGLRDPERELTHGQQTKIRNGTLRGLQALLRERGIGESGDGPADIHRLVALAMSEWEDPATVVPSLIPYVATGGRR